MKIKDYKCKCSHDDFFFADKGNQKGIYCSYCGKWFKWADKDEQNLAIKQEPFINKSCLSSGVCEHDKQKVLDKIKAEIEQLPITDTAVKLVIDVIDKYRESKE